MNDKTNNSTSIWKAATAVLAVILLVIAVMHCVPFSGTAAEPVRDGSILAHWTDDAKAKQELISFVEAAVDENSAGYIPVENRIAVFDLDGTLFCETDPDYFDYQLLMYRVLEDPSYKDKASDFEKEVALKIKERIETGVTAKGLEVDHGKAVASAFEGMTLEEFQEYNLAFRSQPAPGYDGMTRGEAFYVPMVEVVESLKANDFTVYVISGTDRLILRGILDGMLDVPFSRIIGSDESIVASKQGDTDGLGYVYEKGDDLILGGEFLIKNLKMNKVSVIAQEIGVQPVLSFGNSTGDSSMAEYTILNNPYPAKAFMLKCDDLVRENGNKEKADQMEQLCEENGWTAISMKDDWTTIYKEGVVRKAN